MSDYNQFYKENKYNRGLEANDLAREISEYISCGKVLYLGCGEGQDLMFLSNQGFEVFGIDISQPAVENLNALAKQRGVAINAEVNDIRSFEFDEKYDVILSEASLHFLEEEEREGYIEKMKSHTNENGLNVLGVFDEETSEELHDGMAYWGISLFGKDELFNYYSDWEVVVKRNFKVQLDNGLERSISQIIARNKVK